MFLVNNIHYDSNPDSSTMISAYILYFLKSIILIMFYKESLLVQFSWWWSYNCYSGVIAGSLIMVLFRLCFLFQNHHVKNSCNIIFWPFTYNFVNSFHIHIGAWVSHTNIYINLSVCYSKPLESHQCYPKKKKCTLYHHLDNSKSIEEIGLYSYKKNHN